MSSRVFCVQFRPKARPRRWVAFEHLLLPFDSVPGLMLALATKHQVRGQMLWTRAGAGDVKEVYDAAPCLVREADVARIFVPTVDLKLLVAGAA